MDCQWKFIEAKGDEKPGSLAFHSSIVYQDKMFLFGGSNLEAENNKFFSLDLNNYRWECIKSRGDLPVKRDEHSAVINPADSTMIIFGGFAEG